ncbi:MAG: hypothetical protein BM564_06240 [Bacteroidetes bacterium MedPE-SWsnd-G2]|nr:MAG: hypothetical protein BM564_06240 [Bacteroidetes bacterium MedPE-SWsnd-G2]
MKYLLLLLILPLGVFGQHNITGKFSPAKDYTYAFLYKSTPSGSNYINRSKINSDGSFNIALDSTAAKGIYKIIYATPPEENNFDLIYSGLEDVKLEFSLENGLKFIESNENKLWISYTKSMELINLTISNFYAQGSTNEKAYLDIFKTLKETQDAFEGAAYGTIAINFIKANAPYIPKSFEDVSTYSKHLKSNYLKHIDFGNPILQSSDFLMERVITYIFAMPPNADDATYISHIDDLVDYIGFNNPKIKKSLLTMIWENMTILEEPAVANYVSETYLLELAESTNDTDLMSALTKYKKNSVGEKAHNFEISYSDNERTVNTNLLDLNTADNYLLIFWSSTCGHCLEELPKIKSYLKNNSSIQVIAIGLEESIDSWQNETLNYPNFIHVLAMGKWNSPIADAYDVNGTPSFILLNKEKTIIDKPKDFDTLILSLDKL